MKVLLVEDDAPLNQRLKTALSQAGFVVDVAEDGFDAEYMGDEGAYDAVVLDLGLPGRAGLEVLQHWRVRGNPVPVLILTARDAWHERVDGLRAGADDYLGKPFYVEELVARLNAVIRRHKGNAGGRIRVGGLTLDEDRQAVITCNGTTVLLTAWIGRLGWWGPLVFGLIFMVAVVLGMPGVVFTIAAGTLFGLWMGTLVASLASITGAALGFLTARHLARARVTQLARDRPKFAAVDQAIGAGGWKIVALLRLFPPIPCSLQNYLYGLTPIRFWPYLLTSWLAMLPGNFMYVYIGHAGGVAVRGTHQPILAEWIVVGAGLLTMGVVTSYITRLVRHQLREQTTTGAPPSPG